MEGFEAFYRLAALTRAAEAEWEQRWICSASDHWHDLQDRYCSGRPGRAEQQSRHLYQFRESDGLVRDRVPGGFRPNGLPFGVTLLARAFEDGRIAGLADRLHRAIPNATVGGTGLPLPTGEPAAPHKPSKVAFAVLGAHLSGQPLNWQLTNRNARLVRAARTAPGYSLYALTGTVPAKPGLIYDGVGQGLIELEVWEMDFAAFGSFVAEIPPPLGNRHCDAGGWQPGERLSQRRSRRNRCRGCYRVRRLAELARPGDRIRSLNIALLKTASRNATCANGMGRRRFACWRRELDGAFPAEFVRRKSWHDPC